MDLKEAKVSIIIPAYNAERYIERAIISVQKQTHHNLEILVVNDGSKDRTKETVERMCAEDPTIELINTENRGVSCARNMGMEHATGAWIMFLDADDTLFEDAVESLLACAVTHKADIVAGKAGIIHKDESVTRMDNDNVTMYSGTQGILRALEDRPETYAVWAKLYRRDFIRSVRFPEGRKAHEDSYFVFCCLAQKPCFAVYDKTVYRYFVTQDGTSRAPFSERVFDILALAEEKRRIVEEQFPEYIERSRLMLLKANMALLQEMLKTNDRKYRGVEEKCLKFVQQNGDCFQAAIPQDAKWFWIIDKGYYRVYKFLYQLRNWIRGK